MRCDRIFRNVWRVEYRELVGVNVEETHVEAKNSSYRERQHILANIRRQSYKKLSLCTILENDNEEDVLDKAEMPRKPSSHGCTTRTSVSRLSRNLSTVFASMHLCFFNNMTLVADYQSHICTSQLQRHHQAYRSKYPLRYLCAQDSRDS